MTLIVEKVSKRFHDRVGLTEVSFMTGPGEIVAVTGPNGAGKTTLMRVACGELSPTEGYIRIDGHSARSFRRDLVAFTGDQRHVFTGFTGYDYLRVWKLLYARFDDALFASFITRFSWDLLSRVDHMPLGVRSLFLTLGALACRPQILLIDEPFQHIAPIERDNLCMILRSFADEHRSTVLLASTELYEQESIIDRVVVLKEGKLLFSGSLEKARQTHRVVPYAEDTEGLLIIGPVLAEHLVFSDEDIGREPTMREVVTGYLNGYSD